MPDQIHSLSLTFTPSSRSLSHTHRHTHTVPPSPLPKPDTYTFSNTSSTLKRTGPFSSTSTIAKQVVILHACTQNRHSSQELNMN